jgi:hypothetical protein
MNLMAFPNEERGVSRGELNGPQIESLSDAKIYSGNCKSTSKPLFASGEYRILELSACGSFSPS